MKGIDTMTTKKLTKRDHFNALLNLEEVKANPVLVESIEHELDLLAHTWREEFQINRQFQQNFTRIFV